MLLVLFCVEGPDSTHRVSTLDTRQPQIRPFPHRRNTRPSVKHLSDLLRISPPSHLVSGALRRDRQSQDRVDQSFGGCDVPAAVQTRDRKREKAADGGEPARRD